MSSKNHLCYFCDKLYPSFFIANYNYNDICICKCCEIIIPINNIEYNIKCSVECCVCFEYKALIKLPTCIHKVCYECCKTIYFGSTTNERPIHWREMNIECPEWPNEFNDDYNNDYNNNYNDDYNNNDDIDPELIKYNEYCEYENKYFDIETKSYDELIIIRENLILERPDWMKTEEIINYENDILRYHTEFVKLKKEWKNYNKNKTKGNSSCPLCRAKL